VLAVAQGIYIIPSTHTSDASVAANAQVITKAARNLLNLQSQLASRSQNDGLALPVTPIDPLHGANKESCSLSSARLGLANYIPRVHHWPDCPLLDGTGPLEAIGVDAPEKVVLEIQIVEGLIHWILVADAASDGGHHSTGLKLASRQQAIKE